MKKYSVCHGDLNPIAGSLGDYSLTKVCSRIPLVHTLYPITNIMTFNKKVNYISGYPTNMYGVKAMNTGRNFIGIEKDIHYFEIAKNRIETAVKSFMGGRKDT